MIAGLPKRKIRRWRLSYRETWEESKVLLDFFPWFVKSSARLYGRKLPLEFSIPKICEDDGLIAP